MFIKRLFLGIILCLVAISAQPPPPKPPAAQAEQKQQPPVAKVNQEQVQPKVTQKPVTQQQNKPAQKGQQQPQKAQNNPKPVVKVGQKPKPVQDAQKPAEQKVTQQNPPQQNPPQQNPPQQNPPQQNPPQENPKQQNSQQEKVKEPVPESQQKLDELKAKYGGEKIFRDLEHIKSDLKHIVDGQSAGHLSNEEALAYFFRMHDFDDNNGLDGLELIQAYQHTMEGEYENSPVDAFESMVDNALEAFDANNDGIITYFEFVVKQPKAKSA